MRFIYFQNPNIPSQKLDAQGEKLAGIAEKPQDLAEQRRQLAPFLGEIYAQQQNPRKLADLKLKLDETNNIAEIRHGLVTAAEAKVNPNLSAGRLAALYLKPDSTVKDKLSYTFDAGKNDNVENFVGAGDAFAQSVKAIKVESKNESGINVICARAIRTFNPANNRIGYYDAVLLAQGEYKYIPIHTGDKVTILETQSVTPTMVKQEHDLRFNPEKNGDQPAPVKIAQQQLGDLKRSIGISSIPANTAYPRAQNFAPVAPRAIVHPAAAPQVQTTPLTLRDKSAELQGTMLEKAIAKAEAKGYMPIIERACAKYNLDPKIFVSQMRYESGFNPLVASPVGAGGLMQFMPGTAISYGMKNILPLIVVVNNNGKERKQLDPRDDRANPELCIMGAAMYMRRNLNRFNGRYDLALAGYNAGEGRIKNNMVPNIRETQLYVKNILSMSSSAPTPRRTPTDALDEDLA